jgi:hypothetical protein
LFVVSLASIADIRLRAEANGYPVFRRLRLPLTGDTGIPAKGRMLLGAASMDCSTRKDNPNMKRTLALTTALAIASLGVSAFAQTTPANEPAPQTQSGKKQKKQHTEKKEKKEKTSSQTSDKK